MWQRHAAAVSADQGPLCHAHRQGQREGPGGETRVRPGPVRLRRQQHEPRAGPGRLRPLQGRVLLPVLLHHQRLQQERRPPAGRLPAAAAPVAAAGAAPAADVTALPRPLRGRRRRGLLGSLARRAPLGRRSYRDFACRLLGVAAPPDSATPQCGRCRDDPSNSLQQR